MNEAERQRGREGPCKDVGAQLWESEAKATRRHMLRFFLMTALLGSSILVPHSLERVPCEKNLLDPRNPTTLWAVKSIPKLGFQLST